MPQLLVLLVQHIVAVNVETSSMMYNSVRKMCAWIPDVEKFIKVPIKTNQTSQITWSNIFNICPSKYVIQK